MRKLLGTSLGVAVLALLAVGLVPVAAGAGVARATAATTVDVQVGDTAGLAGDMTMTVTPDTAPAGKVTFKVTNNGTILHEMVVLKLKAGTTWDGLKIDSKNKVSESTTVGEVGNVPKGKTKSVTLKLKKGNYVLVCNIAKHYGLGMRAAFTVS
jgi:uncharacterized cupredoxin-like copper-binding protein